MVASAEASLDFVNFWREKINPGYVSPYPETRRRILQVQSAFKNRHQDILQDGKPYYFGKHDNLYTIRSGEDKVDSSFMNFYEKGNFVTSWDKEELATSYDLAETVERLKNLQANPDSSVAPSEVPSNDPLAPSESAAPTGSGENSFIERTIQCIEPNEGVSFEVTPTNFPVYIIQSKYNTDDNYDYGQFSILETKLNNAKLAIGTIPAFFPNTGVYVFGDHETPFTP